MRFPTKVAIVVREDLAVWQKLNGARNDVDKVVKGLSLHG
jgi:hypothetical protein